MKYDKVRLHLDEIQMAIYQKEYRTCKEIYFPKWTNLHPLGLKWDITVNAKTQMTNAAPSIPNPTQLANIARFIILNEIFAILYR